MPQAVWLRAGDTVHVRIEWDGGLLRVELDVLPARADPDEAG